MTDKKNMSEFVKGWKAGYQSGLRKSGLGITQCGCTFDESDELIVLCDAHKIWFKEGMKRKIVEVAQTEIDKYLED